jgi:predicted enzyme related to lactoylglutathione lyase
MATSAAFFKESRMKPAEANNPDRKSGKALGVGGVFLRAADPEKLYAWYEEHLGIKRTPDGAFAFFSEAPREMTVLGFFPQDTDYFGPGKQQAMLNLRVDDLDAVLERLRTLGVVIDPKREDADYGRFAWFNDLEGNRVELWQPPGIPQP